METNDPRVRLQQSIQQLGARLLGSPQPTESQLFHKQALTEMTRRDLRSLIEPVSAAIRDVRAARGGETIGLLQESFRQFCGTTWDGDRRITDTLDDHSADDAPRRIQFEPIRLVELADLATQLVGET